MVMDRTDEDRAEVRDLLTRLNKEAANVGAFLRAPGKSTYINFLRGLRPPGIGTSVLVGIAFWVGRVSA